MSIESEAAPHRRFRADWIAGRRDDEEQQHSDHSTFEAAWDAALTASKKAGRLDWVMVREQVPGSVGGRWPTVRSWIGDYDSISEMLPW
jgi:hypothetical protein